jgi:hypothetical protein
MRSLFWIRATGVALALVAASFISFPSFPHGMFTAEPPSVDRALKGDRLRSISPAVFPHELGLRLLPPTHAKIPVGCDRAFSAISSPQLAHVFGRCVA